MTTETNPPIVTTSPVVVDSPVVSSEGNQPTVTSPIVETNPAPPAADPVADPTDPIPAPTTEQSKTTPEWAQKRINELTAKRYEAERVAQAEIERANAADARSAELLSQLANRDPAAPPAPGTPAKPAAPVASEEEFNRRVTMEAARVARINDFNKACDNIAAIGKNEFKDSWDDTLKNLSLVGAVGTNVSPEFLETAVELQQPHKVLHYLGQNLEEAEKIVKLPPKRMALEMARLEAKIMAPTPAPVAAPVSAAPAPVIPVTGAAKVTSGDLTDPNLPVEEFMALRSKQMEEKRNRYRR